MGIVEPVRARDLADTVRSGAAEARELIAEASRELAVADALARCLDAVSWQDDIAIRAAIDRARVAAARATLAAGGYRPVAEVAARWSARRWGGRLMWAGLRLLVLGWPRRGS